MPMTCVFDMSVRDFDGNPHRAETPFGRPIVVADEDLAAEVDRLRRALEFYRDATPEDFANDNGFNADAALLR